MLQPKILSWGPPEDPDRPPNPYIAGFTVAIQCHAPPPPFGALYGLGPRPLLEGHYLYNLTQSKLVVAHPALETAPPVQPEIAELTITAPIAIGCDHGAQIVACTVVPQGEGESRKPFQAAAKIYDPLYYRFFLSLASGPRDTTWEADQDYSREAAAYEHLQKGGQTGSFAPEYYGSWTFSLPITSSGESYSRPVRLVLIELLQGTTIQNTFIHNNPDLRAGKDALHYPEEYRLEVLARAMDAVVWQWARGMDQGDFANRNVMLVADTAQPAAQVAVKGGPALPRVVLIDYNQSTVFDLVVREGKHIYAGELLEHPSSPITSSWAGLDDNFGGWIPDEWQETPELIREWLVRRFGGEDQRARYAPVPEPVAPSIS